MTTALWLFVVVIIGDVVALVYDLWRLLTGRATITAYVRAHPAWGIPLVDFQLVGALALAVHFWGS